MKWYHVEMYESHTRESGVSVLGALVVALALGTTAVAGFEFAGASPPSALFASSGLVARSNVKPTSGKSAPTPPIRPSDIELKCDKLKIRAAREGKSTGGGTQKLPKGLAIQEDFCVSAIYKDGKVLEECQGLVAEVYINRDGTATIQSRPPKNDDGEVKKGTCHTSFCKYTPLPSSQPPPSASEQAPPSQLPSPRGSGMPAAAAATGGVPEGARCTNALLVSNKDDIKNAVTDPGIFSQLSDRQREGALAGMDPREQDQLRNALEGRQEGVEDAIRESKRKYANLAKREEDLKAIGRERCNDAPSVSSSGCQQLAIEIARTIELRKAEETRIKQLLEQRNRLAAARKSLDASGGPPGRRGDPDPRDDDPRNRPPVGSPEEYRRQGYQEGTRDAGRGGGGMPGGMGGGGQQGRGGQPQNTFPQQQYPQQQYPQQQYPQQQYPQQPCSMQYVCNNNSIYIQQMGCQQNYQPSYGFYGQQSPYQQPQQQSQPQFHQQCQYGCQQGSSVCNQTQQCLPPPPQPDPSSCNAGTWKPKYGGQGSTCMIGWECTPGNIPPPNIDAPTAHLSCQPKVADVGMELLLTFSCSAGMSSGSGFNTSGKQFGSATTTLSLPPGGTNTANFGLTCTKDGRSGSAQCSVQVGKPGIVFTSNPKSVQSGKKSALGWVTAGMQSCVISSVSNEDAMKYGFKHSLQHLPDFTSQNAGNASVNGIATTPPLTAINNTNTFYGFLLNCGTLGGGTRNATSSISATP